MNITMPFGIKVVDMYLPYCDTLLRVGKTAISCNGGGRAVILGHFNVTSSNIFYF